MATAHIDPEYNTAEAYKELLRRLKALPKPWHFYFFSKATETCDWAPAFIIAVPKKGLVSLIVSDTISNGPDGFRAAFGGVQYIGDPRRWAKMALKGFIGKLNRPKPLHGIACSYFMYPSTPETLQECYRDDIPTNPSPKLMQSRFKQSNTSKEGLRLTELNADWITGALDAKWSSVCKDTDEERCHITREFEHKELTATWERIQADPAAPNQLTRKPATGRPRHCPANHKGAEIIPFYSNFEFPGEDSAQSLYEHLRTLEAGWTVYYEPYTEKMGAPDFVIAHKKYGILLVECKPRYGHRYPDGSLSHMMACVAALTKSEALGTEIKATVFYATYFSTPPNNPKERFRVLNFSDGVENGLIQRMDQHKSTDYTAMVDRLRSTLAHPYITLPNPYAPDRTEDPTPSRNQADILRHLHDEAGRFVVVEGGPGTGKTLCAIEDALHWANKKKKVLYMTFTRALKGEVAGIAGSKFKVHNLASLFESIALDGGFIELCADDYMTRKHRMKEIEEKIKWTTDAHRKSELDAELSRLSSNRTPLTRVLLSRIKEEGDAIGDKWPPLLMQLIGQHYLSEQDKFDAIICDEGQNYRGYYWDGLKSLLRADGRFHVFYDSLQPTHYNPYGGRYAYRLPQELTRDDSDTELLFGEEVTPHSLTRIYRNPAKIAALLKMIDPTVPSDTAINWHGIINPPIVTNGNGENAYASCLDAINSFLQAGFLREEIVLLTDLSEYAHSPRWDEFRRILSPEKKKEVHALLTSEALTSIARYQGREKAAVILCVVHDRSDITEQEAESDQTLADILKADKYIDLKSFLVQGISRATNQITIIAREHLAKKLQQECARIDRAFGS